MYVRHACETLAALFLGALLVHIFYLRAPGEVMGLTEMAPWWFGGPFKLKLILFRLLMLSPMVDIGLTVRETWPTPND